MASGRRSNQQEPSLIELLARRRDLRHDITTVPLISEHLLYAADLTLDLAKLPHEIGQHVIGNVHLLVVPHTQGRYSNFTPGGIATFCSAKPSGHAKHSPPGL